MAYKKSTNAEIERRIASIYQLIIRRETYSNICRYTAQEWGVTRRQTDRYLEKARQQMAEEAAIARRNSFDEQLAIRRALFSKAYSDKNWRLCLDVLKDECALMNMYPVRSQPTELDAVRVLVDANVVPQEVLEKISTGLTEFQRSALEAFKNSK